MKKLEITVMRIDVRLLILTLAALAASAVAAQSATSPTSFKVIDQACVAEKVTSCMGPMTTPVNSNLQCPAGYSHNGMMMPSSGFMLPMKRCDLANPALLTPDALQKLAPVAGACKTMVESRPDAFGCLVNVDVNRIVTSLEQDIRLLIKQVCDAQGGKNCRSIVHSSAAPTE